MPERTIPTRDPIRREASGLPISRDNPSVTAERAISTRAPISREVVGRGVSFERQIPTREPSQTELSEINRRIFDWGSKRTLADFGIGSPSTNIQANDSTGDGKLPIYGSDNPFEILGDAFLRAFGGQTYSPPRESERTVIESAGSGSNTGLVLVILAAAGFGIYWFYFRKG